jgi:hypothetical protein
MNGKTRRTIMPATISPEVEQLVQKHLDGKAFLSANDVLLAAMRLFQQYQTHVRLREDVKAGFEELERGECLELEDDQALKIFFDEVKTRGRRMAGQTP